MYCKESSLKKVIFFKTIIHLSIISFLFPTMTAMAATVTGGANGITISALPANHHSVTLNAADGLILSDKNGNFSHETGFVDGQYHYQVLALAKAKHDKYKATLNNGRDKLAKAPKQGLKAIESGAFRLSKGQVIAPKAKEK